MKCFYLPLSSRGVESSVVCALFVVKHAIPGKQIV